MQITIKKVKKMNFTFNSGITVAESKSGRTVSGTLVSEGVSRNGNWYEFSELEAIVAKYGNSEIPIRYGVVAGNKHDKNGPIVGKITKLILDKASRSIKFVANIFESFASQVKTGFRVSIEGAAQATYVIEKNTNRIIARARAGMLTDTFSQKP